MSVRIDANGRRLWFDVEGPALVPDGPATRERPTVVLLYCRLTPRASSPTAIRGARLEVLPDAGHFPWKDVPDRFWPLLLDFVGKACTGSGVMWRHRERRSDRWHTKS